MGTQAGYLGVLFFIVRPFSSFFMLAPSTRSLPAVSELQFASIVP
jgi:hypothetical protein